MPRKTDTAHQEPITAALLKSRKDSDVGWPFPYGSDGRTGTLGNSFNATPGAPLSYDHTFSAGKLTGDPHVDAIASVIRSKVGNLDVFLRSQGGKPEEYTPQQLQELNGQLDEAINDCARGFAQDGWSADAVEKYADKAWRADLGTTFFQKTLSNAVAYLPMSGAMLAVSFLLTPILGPLPTMAVGLGVGLYTAYKWSVHALNAAGKVDAKVNDESQGRGRFWSVCSSKGLWQAVGKETLADLAFRTGPRGAVKAVGGGAKLGMQAAGAAPGFMTLFGGLILPAVSAVIGPPTNGAMQVASKMLHGRKGERSAAPLLGIKLEKKKDDSGKQTIGIRADAETRKRNVGRLQKSSGRRFVSMAKKMAPEYRRSFGDAFRQEKKEGMKGKWWELIFGSNVLPGGTLGDLVSLGGDAIGATAGNVVSTFGNVATSVLTGPGNVTTRAEVGKHSYNKPKPVKGAEPVAKHVASATVATPRNTPVHSPQSIPARTAAAPTTPTADHRQVELSNPPPTRRIPLGAPAPIIHVGPTQQDPNVSARFSNVPPSPPHLLSPSTEHVAESHTVIPRPEMQPPSDRVLNLPAVPTPSAPPSILGIGRDTRVDPRDPFAPHSSLDALPIGMPRDVPAQWFGPQNQTSASRPAPSAVELEHVFGAPAAVRPDQPSVAASAMDNQEAANNNGAGAALSVGSQETIRESRDARPTLQAPDVDTHGQRASDVNAPVPVHQDQPHVTDTAASDCAGSDTGPDFRRGDRKEPADTVNPRCGSQAPAANRAPASDTMVQSTPPNTPRGVSNRIPIPVARGRSLSMN